MSEVCTCGGAQRIAELKRARIEMEARLTKQMAPALIPDGVAQGHKFDEGFEDAWRGDDCHFENSSYSAGHAAGRATVEAAISKRLEE